MPWAENDWYMPLNTLWHRCFERLPHLASIGPGDWVLEVQRLYLLHAAPIGGPNGGKWFKHPLYPHNPDSRTHLSMLRTHSTLLARALTFG